MNKLKIASLLFGTAVFFLVGCSKYDDINTNPDAATSVTSGMLATNLILDITKQSTSKWFLNDYVKTKYIAWGENLSSYQYNKFDRSDFGSLKVLINADKMVEAAPTEEVKKSYQALAHFVKAYKFFQLSLKVGDVPYSEALKGEIEGFYKPKYDTQKEIFVGILNELDEADKLFSEGVDFDGDPVYGGDVESWRKLVNSFELKVLINLYKKTADTDLKVARRFTDILNNRPVFESNSDNFQLIHSDASGQKYPFYKDGNNYTIYPMLSSSLVDPLKEYQDNRLFYYGEPSPAKIDDGLTAEDWDAYVGINESDEYENISTKFTDNDFSNLNLRYTQSAVSEPTFMFGYAQMCFTIAEAAARGIVNADAEDYYKKGITAAMTFVSDNTDAVYTHNKVIDGAYISTYLTQTGVAFAATLDDQVKQIMTQKFISTFLQMPLNAYFEYRRTGHPEFPINPISNMNSKSDRLPVRWLYPDGEFSFNKANLEEAINRQYSSDDVNELMWILK